MVMTFIVDIFYCLIDPRIKIRVKGGGKWKIRESLNPSDDDREKIWGKSRTFAGDVWYRFRKKPTAIAGFVIIVILLILSFAGPLFTKYSYSDQNLEVDNIPPLMKVF